MEKNMAEAVNSFRYENKFPMSDFIAPQKFLHLIKINSYHFTEIYHQRQVNSIYLDTPNLSFFSQNRVGTGDRKKVRIRWYGDDFQVKKPRLEFKVKRGWVGTKHIFDVNPFEINARNRFTELRTSLKESELPDWVREELSILRPSLINSYQRRYFLSDDKRFRITLDWSLAFNSAHELAGKTGTHVKHFPTILELKYDRENRKDAENISQEFPFRMDKFSKYIVGVEASRKIFN